MRSLERVGSRSNEEVSENSLSLRALAEQINDAHHRAEGLVRQGIEHAAEAGRLLSVARQHVTAGGWTDWLEANFVGSVRTAQRYLKFHNSLPQLRRDTTDVSRLSMTAALRLLSDPGADPTTEGRDAITLIPPEGMVSVITADADDAARGQDVALIVPSEFAGYYYVTAVTAASGEDGGSVAVGTKRPVLLSQYTADQVLPPQFVGREVTHVPAAAYQSPWSHNEILYDSRDEHLRSVFGRGRELDGEILNRETTGEGEAA